MRSFVQSAAFVGAFVGRNDVSYQSYENTVVFLFLGGLPLRQLGTKLGTPDVADFTPEAAANVRKRSPFDLMMRTLPSVDPDALAGGPSEFLNHGGRDRLLPGAFRQRLGAVGIGLGLIAYRLQSGDALL
jgi:hypothetical protein